MATANVWRDGYAGSVCPLAKQKAEKAHAVEIYREFRNCPGIAWKRSPPFDGLD
ncbi:hypothetical protein ACSV5N_01675 [Agrobacterium salinitolerans]|uniref:hypothetical protein n=1 Tax=Agrobacterium salinitolerans TaxID=1183413 RepID=UPI003FD0D533